MPKTIAAESLHIILGTGKVTVGFGHTQNNMPFVSLNITENQYKIGEQIDEDLEVPFRLTIEMHNLESALIFQRMVDRAVDDFKVQPVNKINGPLDETFEKNEEN